MIVQSKGKIFVEAERGLTETSTFRSYNTFNFGNHFNEHKNAFGNLYVFNDDTLASGASLKMLVEETSTLLLLPVVGTIEYKDSLGNETFINTGEIQFFTARKDTTIELSNPYEEGLVNFLQVWLKADEVNLLAAPKIFAFDINAARNSLVSLTTANTFPHVSIGKFGGREEVVYQIKNKKNSLFFFVIEGVFEIQYRLLHERDGLALWDIEEAEIEALSNDAIILLVEVGM